MMKKADRPIEVGDRFETRDKRDDGKLVEVVVADGLNAVGRDRMARIEAGPERDRYGTTKAQRLEWTRQRYTTYRIRTEVHPNNPSAVGRRVKIQENTLREKYKRVSR
ncbi:MAG: hypothetical protein K0Q46_6464 [Rhodococcus erythropolis]|jgi:hypothetical protein|nr:hypothetical protein [Rhodococcus erythropolis]MDF2899678.1 hypothetical protein [Rhodococcus erythropolis]